MRNNQECKICKITARMHEALHNADIKNGLCVPCGQKPIDVVVTRSSWLADLQTTKAAQMANDRRAFFGA